MITIVPDVNVAVKWVLPPQGEGLRDKTVDLLSRHKNAEVRFVVPDLFWAEFGNVLWKAVRTGRLSEQDASYAIEKLLAENLPAVSSSSLLTFALTVANAYGRTVYDSLYVALAVDKGAEMITADERLANALAAHMPVKWLGAI